MEMSEQGAETPQIQQVHTRVHQQSPSDSSPNHSHDQTDLGRPSTPANGLEEGGHHVAARTEKTSKQRGDGGHGGPGRKPRACELSLTDQLRLTYSREG